MHLLQWLLGLENIQLDRDVPLALKWQAPWTIEAWMLVCFGLAVATWVGLIYRRERAPLIRRVFPAGVRCAIIALAVAVLCRPALVLQRDRVEPSFVALVLDTSMSMAERDKYRSADLARSVSRGAGLEEAERVWDFSRFDLASAALTRSGGRAIATLLEHNAVQLATFADRLTLLDYVTRRSTGNGQSQPAGRLAGADVLIKAVRQCEPDGTSTDIAGAISSIMREAQGRRLSAIVLVSDGAATQPGRLNEVLDEAAERQIPIFPVRIGSPAAPLDIALTSVLAEQSVFVNDRLAVQARITARGLVEPVALEVRLIDRQTDTVVDSRQVSIDPKQPTSTVELHVTPTQRGLATYRVEVASLPAETTADNNAESVEVHVLDNELRVLYCEGYPRYEYRYLKNALLREKTIQLSVLLIEADERFVQEGTDPIRAFPESPEELNRFDVVIFGDVDPRSGWLSVAQMKMLLDFVGNAGGGFAMIAGERAAPHRYLGTPLEKLIPVRIDPSFLGQYNTTLLTGFRSRLTPEGRRSRIFTRTLDRDADQPVANGDPSRADLYWYARTLGPRPGATVLSEHPTVRTEAGMMPIVVTGHYGAGKLFFQATDDTWRRRRGSDQQAGSASEFTHDTYWVQMARSLARGLRLSQTRRLTLRTDHSIYAYAAPVRTHARIHDAQLLAAQGETIEVTAENIGDTGNARRDRLKAGPTHRFLLHRLSAEANEFEGTWVPPRPGNYALSITDFSPNPDESVPSVSLRVEPPSLESKSPQADHALLERLADASGGRVVDLDELAEVLGTIPDRSVRIPDDVVEPLWDSKLVFALFALMISMEWVSRKVMGLL
ncbi:MAG: hypothetical protein IID33_01830 [Planctomycetes bacterium]|nr:hypothetical protein [Planctomycetota bacterium]